MRAPLLALQTWKSRCRKTRFGWRAGSVQARPSQHRFQGSFMRIYQPIAGLFLAALLSACGGGSDGTSAVQQPAASTASFPLQSGFRALVANGLSKSFTISGTCSGSGNKSTSPANTAATFEGTAGFSATSTLTLSFSNCTPASTATTSTAYVDSNYDPLGFNSVGVNYGVYLTRLVIPTSVTVGATGTLGTQTLYTNSSKTTLNGKMNLSYVIEADTSTTAIVNLISKIYNTSGTLTATEQDRYRITSTGALAPISIDIQAANGSTNHLVLTFN